MIKYFEKSIYVNLEREFEDSLRRNLSDGEKEFLEWLTEKYVKEESNQL